MTVSVPPPSSPSRSRNVSGLRRMAHLPNLRLILHPLRNLQEEPKGFLTDLLGSLQYLSIRRA
ncbi:MAG: hypothetical protein EHM77_06665, partial [Planctomycetaceae bacterium]